MKKVRYRTIIMVMIMVNIAEAKARLSEYLDAVERGEEVVICKRNRPVAELRRVAPARTGPRDLSPIYPGWTFMTDAFFEPMTDAELAEWYGSDAPPAHRVAEKRQRYVGTRRRRSKRGSRS